MKHWSFFLLLLIDIIILGCSWAHVLLRSTIHSMFRAYYSSCRIRGEFCLQGGYECSRRHTTQTTTILELERENLYFIWSSCTYNSKSQLNPFALRFSNYMHYLLRSNHAFNPEDVRCSSVWTIVPASRIHLAILPLKVLWWTFPDCLHPNSSGKYISVWRDAGVSQERARTEELLVAGGFCVQVFPSLATDVRSICRDPGYDWLWLTGWKLFSHLGWKTGKDCLKESIQGLIQVYLLLLLIYRFEMIEFKYFRRHVRPVFRQWEVGDKCCVP